MPSVRLVRGSGAHLAVRVIAAAVIAWLLLSPFLRDLTPSDYGWRTDVAVLALAAVALNLLIGFTGQISIGHSAFFGLGAYTTAVLVSDQGWTPGWTFPVAAVLCFASGVVVGIPALRLTGMYLALVTVALAQLFPALVRRFDGLTGGSAGVDGVRYDPPPWTGLDDGRLDRSRWLYLLALVLLGLGWLVARNLVKSRTGRAMVAVRDNATAAAVAGVNVAFVKTVTFGVSAALAGVAGSLFALRQSHVSPDALAFTILGAVVFLVVVAIGGVATLTGPLVGAVVYHRIDEYTRELPRKTYLPEPVATFLDGRANLASLVFAVLLIALVVAAPDGLVGLGRRVGRRFVVVTPPGVPPATAAAPAPSLQPPVIESVTVEPGGAT